MGSFIDLGVNSTALIHPKAHVEGVSIGARTRVWQFASVIRGAKVGHDCVIGDGATIDGAAIGDRCRIGKGAAVNPGVVIHDDVFVGPMTIFVNDAYPSSDSDGFDIEELISRRFVTIEICSKASIGARVVIMPGVKVGEGSLIAAASVVDREVPAMMMWHRDGRVYPLPVARNHDRNRMRRSC